MNFTKYCDSLLKHPDISSQEDIDTLSTAGELRGRQVEDYLKTQNVTFDLQYSDTGIRHKLAQQCAAGAAERKKFADNMEKRRNRPLQWPNDWIRTDGRHKYSASVQTTSKSEAQSSQPDHVPGRDTDPAASMNLNAISDCTNLNQQTHYPTSTPGQYSNDGPAPLMGQSNLPPNDNRVPQLSSFVQSETGAATSDGSQVLRYSKPVWHGSRLAVFDWQTEAWMFWQDDHYVDEHDRPVQ
ncbi:uncharacterized protein I206_104426 [Kwoniella pini CBS 10737]|uniref:Uncharacterized protein n=1 Tax=Kwoniella pini CBS 10737 TaxID=1296096 RepID=A0A1B9I1R1_9TREE|nr:uncharacterized protein I206_03993 [Kwoniella pini CBS 10737]OCF49472.1 hypothetical protein I206_03993 [Kwoniella pini CBS 10737]